MSKTVQFFETAWSSFLVACQEKGLTQRWLNVGGSVICLQFAGTAMIPHVASALEHLAIPPQVQADLRVGVWDSTSTAVPMSPPPWSEELFKTGELQDNLTDSVQVAYHLGSSTLSILHKDRQKAVVWMRNAEECPYYEQAAPLRTILHWWCSQKGQQLVHGAAIGTSEGAVLLTGKGGSGKSTTALLGLLAGMRYLGDDYVLCEISDSEEKVYSLYNSAKIDSKTLLLLPELTNKLTNEGILFKFHGSLKR